MKHDKKHVCVETRSKAHAAIVNNLLISGSIALNICQTGIGVQNVISLLRNVCNFIVKLYWYFSEHLYTWFRSQYSETNIGYIFFFLILNMTLLFASDYGESFSAQGSRTHVAETDICFLFYLHLLHYDNI